MEEEDEHIPYAVKEVKHYISCVETYFENMKLTYRGKEIDSKDLFYREVNEIYRKFI